jgi:glycosyltransferase involved in cell wall biosynthesis
MACGLSVIGTNIGGIPEVIKNKRSGFIVSSEKQALVRLEQLIKDAYLREKLAKFGRKFVIKNFDLSKIGKELINIIS